MKANENLAVRGVESAQKHVSLAHLSIVKEYIDKKAASGSGGSGGLGGSGTDGKIAAADLDERLVASDAEVKNMFSI